jgi:hypothetical protein
MKQVIVCTTINSPTDAIRRFDAMPDWHLVVVGDRETPLGYTLERGTYMAPEDQETYDRQLSDAIGWNCLQRRNFGFLLAKDMGAEVVATVDDDNVPMDGWGKDLMIGKPTSVRMFPTESPAFDPIGATEYEYLWHRGFPIQLVSKRRYTFLVQRETITPDIQADFWDGDPDVDAICRMEHAPECNFDPRSFPMASDKPGPFNSQNTFLSAKVLPDYFLFPGIGRQDDIWASYYVQAKGHRCVYGKASVFHARNPHDLTRDMLSEFLGYSDNLNLLNAMAQNIETIWNYLPERAVTAWDLYRRHFG